MEIIVSLDDKKLQRYLSHRREKYGYVYLGERNESTIEYVKLHNPRIGNYRSIGCIWSQAIVDVMEGRTISNLRKEAFADFDQDEYRVLSFFDGSYRSGSYSPLEDGAAFYECISKLLEELPHTLVIVKEKKSEKAFWPYMRNLAVTAASSLNDTNRHWTN